MTRTLLALWAIIFGSVLAIVALVIVSTNQRETQARLDLAGLLRAQLEPYNRDLRQLFENYDRELQQALDGFDPQSSGTILALERHPLCGQVVVIGDDGFKGRLWHPEPERISMSDRSLIEDAVTWIRDNNFSGRDQASNAASQMIPVPPTQSAQTQSAQTQSAQTQSVQTQSAQLPPTQAPPAQAPSVQSPVVDKRSSGSIGLSPLTKPIKASRAGEPTRVLVNSLGSNPTNWTTWYHGRGLVLAYWTKSLHQTVTMVILPRGRWLSDVVAALPDNSESVADSLLQLIDVEGTVVSQWGNMELVGSQVIDAEMPVDDPLDGWRLRMILTPEARSAALGLDSRWWRACVAASFSLGLILLGAIVTVNINRQLRLARQQVSFVNQVSHELRTPLTNIRMYTDLAVHGLEAHRDQGLDDELDRLAVIQQETMRLGRLIENVLAFARSGKERPLRANRVENPESLIDGVLATFAPQLAECQMSVERRTGTVQPLSIDREAVEQILINLISNAIKYASSGKLLRIETSYTTDRWTIRVTDQGPGIPKRLRRRVFEPFVRGSNRLEDPAGTGIGLSIARQLARQHGGDCRLLTTPTGCTFEVGIAGRGGS